MTKFRDYVTDVAFRLTLGKTHITAMAAVKAGNPEMALGMGIWVTAIHALEARGLVESPKTYNTPTGRYAEGAKCNDDVVSMPFHKRFKLTKEGELVWQLLELAGLVELAKPKRKAA